MNTKTTTIKSDTKQRYGIISRFRLFLLLFPIAISACQLIAPYDEITDQRVVALIASTEKTLAQADSDLLTLEESRRFLNDSLGEVRALQMRADAQPKNEYESRILKGIENQLTALQTLNRPLRSSLATGLRLELLDLQQVQIAKKRSNIFERSLRDHND